MSPPPQLFEPKKDNLCASEDEEHWAQLVSDVQTGNCALFVGSGCSIPDYGTWRQMVERVGADAHQEVPPDLRPIGYPRFLGLCRETMGEEAYRASLGSILTPNGKEPYRPIHGAMVRTAFASFVTTNYDASLENADCLQPKVLPPGSVLSYPDDRLDPTRLRSRSMFHLHGRAYDGQACLLPRIVVTDRDFEEAYRRNDVTNTLRSLLSELSVLFVGFSSDDGVLQRVIREHMGPYEDNLLQAPHPPKGTGDDVRYYVLRDVCVRRWRVSVANGEEAPPIEIAAVDRREWDVAHAEARSWFEHPPWELGRRVRPIVYARSQDDNLHTALTSLMHRLQTTPGCAVAGLRGMQ